MQIWAEAPVRTARRDRTMAGEQRLTTDWRRFSLIERKEEEEEGNHRIHRRHRIEEGLTQRRGDAGRMSRFEISDFREGMEMEGHLTTKDMLLRGVGGVALG
jgi:hypothetical protein